jgi:hypothetical protein
LNDIPASLIKSLSGSKKTLFDDDSIQKPRVAKKNLFDEHDQYKNRQ